MARIRTVSGRLMDPFNPLRADVDPMVLMHAICQLNRFTGHAKYPYSVGQHTLNLVNYVAPHLKRAALIHDWQEGWFNDLASPVKAELPQYRYAESYAGAFIAEVMGVDKHDLEELDYYDKCIYVNERDAMFDILIERGMGDDRTKLSDPCGVLNFTEMNWRDVRYALNTAHAALFPTTLEAP